MPLYSYKAIDGNGNEVSGSLAAPTEDKAVKKLSTMGLTMQELTEVNIDTPKNVPPLESVEQDIPPLEESLEVEAPKKQSRPTDWSTVGKNERGYYPLSSTLRLYAGWLLAWYVLAYALGAYQSTRELSFSIPYVEAMLPPYSPLVLTLSLICFLFLCITGLHRAWGGGKAKGVLMTLLGIAIFVVYRINV